MLNHNLNLHDLLNPQYLCAAEDWQVCSDCFAGEREVKHAGERYLPRTEGQMADAQFGMRRYDAYKARANYFNYLATTIATMLGIMHREPPEAVAEACNSSRLLVKNLSAVDFFST